MGKAEEGTLTAIRNNMNLFANYGVQGQRPVAQQQQVSASQQTKPAQGLSAGIQTPSNVSASQVWSTVLQMLQDTFQGQPKDAQQQAAMDPKSDLLSPKKDEDADALTNKLLDEQMKALKKKNEDQNRLEQQNADKKPEKDLQKIKEARAKLGEQFVSLQRAACDPEMQHDEQLQAHIKENREQDRELAVLQRQAEVEYFRSI